MLTDEQLIYITRRLLSASQHELRTSTEALLSDLREARLALKAIAEHCTVEMEASSHYQAALDDIRELAWEALPDDQR